MPWFRLDDSFHSHPKVIAAGNEATGLYVRCGTYAAQHLTDGFIPQHVALLYGSDVLADSLVRAKLWRRVRGGWQMPDYLDYNPSREQVTERRQVRAEAGRKGGLASGKTRSKPEANASPLLEPPTRPDPCPEPPANTGELTGTGLTSAGTRRRGTRLPDDWMPTRDLVEWARRECPSVDSRAETDRFRDYWHARAGTGATKLDWPATWRNWMRKAAEQQPARGRHSRQAETDQLFDRAMERAKAREEAGDPQRNGHPDQVRQSALPRPGD
jgi:hypothetical protein